MSRMNKFLFAIALCCMSMTAIVAQTSEQTTTARDRQSVNITVYNSNLGLVRETRRLTLPIGTNCAEIRRRHRADSAGDCSISLP